MSEATSTSSPADVFPRVSWKALVPPLVTATVFVLIFQKVPLGQFVEALRGADYSIFFGALVPFSVLYFALDSLVLAAVVRWFHGPMTLREIAPVRAVDYLVSILSHRASQGAMVVYLARRLSTSLLAIASSILFLDLLQKTHLALWASVGMALVPGSLPPALLLAPLVVIVFWFVFLRYVHGGFTILGRVGRAPDWRLFRTFRLAGPERYVTVLLLKAPLLLLAVVAHYYALQAFGIQIPFFRLLATLPIIFIVGALPINVARLGTTPLAWIFFHGHLAPAAALLAYSTAGHLTFMLANALLGAAFLPRAYRELFAFGGGPATTTL